MDRRLIPKDSALNLFVDALSITEVPVSYQVLSGLSAIGACLKRNVWVNQVDWKVYPNLSILLIGPSGIGKDTSINAAMEMIRATEAVPILGGKTIEALKAQMVDLGKPAACVFAAAELTAFLGGKDYQKSIVQELTDLLSSNEACDVTTKSEGKKVIMQPTLTFFGGSTEAWLGKSMPDGAFEGGFIGRFILTCEDRPARNIAWVGYDNDREDIVRAVDAKAKFVEVIKETAARFSKAPQEMGATPEARDFYRNWYANRFNYFSKILAPYANRSRDHVHRLAMLMAVSRGRGYLEESDYQFAATAMSHIAASVDKTIAPMLKEQRGRGRPRKEQPVPD